MSYILEALRRAETERERKRRVPGLHAQPVPVVPAEDPGPARSKAWLWAVVGVGAGVVATLVWRNWPGAQDVDEASQARVAVAGSVAPHGEPAAAAAPVAAPAAAAMPASEPAATAPAKAPAPARRAAPPTPKAAAQAKPAAPRAPPERAARPATTVAAANATPARPAPAQVTTPAPASAPEPRLRTLAELPEDLRRGVPQLAFGGSVYSEIAAQRMVIFNGQVLREGDAVTDDLLVEQIRPRSAVMRVRGQRFEITF